MVYVWWGGDALCGERTARVRVCLRACLCAVLDSGLVHGVITLHDWCSRPFCQHPRLNTGRHTYTCFHTFPIHIHTYTTGRGARSYYRKKGVVVDVPTLGQATVRLEEGGVLLEGQ